MTPVTAQGDMQYTPLVLVLADISGYTRFVHMHRLSEAHAEVIVSELLEEVIAATEPPLELHQLLGDAAVFFARSDGSSELARTIFAQVQRAGERFRLRAAELTGECTLCACDACRTAGRLRLKVVVHHGEAVLTRQRGFVKLAGEEVIVAHRLLKNTIEADEYVLVTEPFRRLLGDPPGARPECRTEPCDGVGEIEVAVYYPAGPPPQPQVAWRDRLHRAVALDAHYVRRQLTRGRGRRVPATPDAPEPARAPDGAASESPAAP